MSDQSSTEYVSVPAIIHFMPGCDENASSWKEANPGFLGIMWKEPALKEVIQNVPFLRDAKPKNAEESRMIEALATIFTFGGVCMSVPLTGVCRLQTKLLQNQYTLLTVFGNVVSNELQSIDTSLLISSARISAMLSMFELFVKAPQHSFKKIMTDFVKASSQASSDTAIVTLPMESLQHFASPETKQASSSLDISALMTHFENMVVSGKRVHTTTKTLFSERLLAALQSRGAIVSDKSSVHDIVVFDDETFNFEQPVPQALKTANEFQSILQNCNGNTIIVFNNAPKDQTGSDMFVRQQLEFMNAKPHWVSGTSESVVWHMTRIAN